MGCQTAQKQEANQYVVTYHPYQEASDTSGEARTSGVTCDSATEVPVDSFAVEQVRSLIYECACVGIPSRVTYDFRCQADCVCGSSSRR